MTLQQQFESGLSHHRAGRLAEAEAFYQQVLAQNPQHIGALHLLGAIAHQSGRNDIAVDLLRRAIRLNPDIPEVHNELGIALKNKGEIDGAIAAYRKAIALRANFVDAFINLGNALKDKGQLDEAISVYRRAIALRPDYAGAYGNLGIALKNKGQLDEAVAAYRQAIALRPNYPEAYYNLGIALQHKGEFEEAIAAFRQAIALRPNFSEAHNNLANALKERGELDEAMAACRQAIALKPDNAEAYYNLGNALAHRCDFDDAIAAYRRAVQLKPDAAHMHWNLAVLLLRTGQFVEGWDEFEWRLKDQTRNLSRNFPQPQWNGEDLAGKTLLLYTEGGYGDAFHFIRYVPQLRGRGAKIILECQPTLVRLFGGVAGIDELIARGQTLPAFDFQISLLSLPRLFKMDLTNIPGSVPYLSAGPQERLRWKGRVEQDGRLNVGLVWAGSPRQTPSEELRSRRLDILAPLARTQNVRFYSLQKGRESGDARPPGMELIDFTGELNDFGETAALIENLDLVISVDTSVAHLAGALGKRVWVLIPFLSDFRWLMDRTDSPWYPTMRLFRQKRPGDWDDVVRQVADELAAWAANRS
jgi:tetratricopeptide (TPR) repeat protein